MESITLADRVQDLGELELATLVCLVANQHCIVDADAIDSLNDAQEELQVVRHARKERSTNRLITVDCFASLWLVLCSYRLY